MGFEEQDADDDCVIVITEEEVLQEAGQKGLTVREAPDGTAWEMSKGDKIGFFPKAFVAGGYTEEQLAMVEAAFDTLRYGHFPGSHSNDCGIVITDATNGKKLTRLTRKMSVFNYIPHDPSFGGGSRNLPVVRVIEDPYGKDSRQTLPIQACDVCAYFLLQKYSPSSYIRRQRAQHYLNRLMPVLNTRASRFDGLGVVVL